ncbi:MAG: replicative DNA helicase [bacterium]|nr:replicative DNA helicase [bacterium]
MSSAEVLHRSPPPSLLERLPHEPEAERAVLGAILLDPTSLLLVIENLREDEFYLDSHRLIFGACLMLQQRGQAADLLTLTNHLREQGLLERVGGASYLSSLVDALPDVANVAHYAEIVRDKAVKRRLIGAAQRILSTCTQDQGEARDAVEEAQKDVYQIAEESLSGGLVHIGKLTRQEVENLESSRATQSTLTGIDTGFVRLNEFTSGLQRKDLVILAARPSMGKTSLALNICAHAALRSDQKIAVFSLEMSSEALVRRLLSSEARVDQKRLATGYLAKSDWPKLTMAAQSLEEVNLWIDDTPGITVLEVSAKARRLKQEHGLDLVMVDYMQLMSGGGRFASRNEEVSALSRGLKAIAKELDVPMLVLSQLSRQPDRRGGDHRPQLSDLRESGSIEQDADVVMFIIRPSMYDPEIDDPRKVELIIAKQRNGPTGEIELVFQHEFTRFENTDFSHDEGEAPW